MRPTVVSARKGKDAKSFPGDGTKMAPVVARYLPPDRPESKWLNT